jgi:hypothetical protein
MVVKYGKFLMGIFDGDIEVDDNQFFFLLCLATSHRVATGIMGS